MKSINNEAYKNKSIENTLKFDENSIRNTNLIEQLKIKPKAGEPLSKYFFIVDSHNLEIMIKSIGSSAITIDKKYIRVQEFMNIIHGLFLSGIETYEMDYIFCPCLTKRENEELEIFFTDEAITCDMTSWKIFYGKEYFKSPYNISILEKTIKDFVRKKEFISKNGGYLADDVRSKLSYNVYYDKNGNEKDRKILQTVKNFEIILENDERFFKKIGFNEFSQQTYLMGDVEWEMKDSYRPWSSHDDSALFSIIQSDYGLNNRNDFFDAVKNVSMRNKFHPVRDILESLKWDKKEHIRNLLVDYLGAEDTEYTYQVMRLFLLGAVARVYQPGCKFDYTMILQGKQGLGKSTFLRMLSLNDIWFNDSLDGLDSDKAAQSLMGSWIVELAELKSLARTAGGVDSVKRFLTATQDKYRLPYERRADIFLRQCVFAGTTNREDFLQDETGNRRFLVVPIGINEPKKSLFDEDAVSEIKAAWAEAVYIWKTEKPDLLLPHSCKKEAEKLQEESTADDGRIGIIEQFLLDENKKRTCAIEIWQEALGENGNPKKWQSAEINSILAKIHGWEKMPKTAKFGKYGVQRGFQKCQISNKADEGNDRFVTLDNVDESKIPFIVN